MATKDPFNWMLSEAIDSLIRAQRLQKRLFTVPQSGPAWEPPIDVLETEHELLNSWRCPASILTTGGRHR